MQFYVYAHRRNDTGEIFYIGKGCGKRAWKKSTRSEWWKRIEAKSGRSVEIIARNLEEAEAFELEQLVISEIGRTSLCNLRDGGLGGVAPDIETRLKMSASLKGKFVSPETREKMRLASTGRQHSDETKEKLRVANLGRKGSHHTEASKAAIGAANKGRVRSAEQRAAISAANKGRKLGPLSESTKNAISIANRGRPCSDEQKAALSKYRTGKKHTPEIIAILTESNRKLNAARRKPILCSNGVLFAYSGDCERWLRDNGYPSAGRANVVSCCTGKLKSAYGLTWQFADHAPA